MHRLPGEAGARAALRPLTMGLSAATAVALFVALPVLPPSAVLVGGRDAGADQRLGFGRTMGQVQPAADGAAPVRRGVPGGLLRIGLHAHERTLLAVFTPWDDFVAGNPTAMTPLEIEGWNVFDEDDSEAEIELVRLEWDGDVQLPAFPSAPPCVVDGGGR